MSAKRIIDVVLPLLENQGRNRTYLDIGANVGNTTNICTHFFNNIHSFEPNPNAIELFKQNVDLTNVMLHEIAISNFIGQTTLTEPNDRSDYSTISKRRLAKWAKQNNTYKNFEVDVKTVDSFNFQDVDFMKIDTEQSENEVVEGSLETIKRCSPIIFMENKRKEASVAKDLIIQLGYNVRTYRADMLFVKKEQS